jgi:hypothetical protein
MFDAGGGEIFTDIYALQNGGYAACGAIYEDPNPRSGVHSDILLVKYDEEGRVEWWNRYRDPAGNKTNATSVIEADNGDWVVTGYRNIVGGGVFVLRVTAEGEVVWFEFYRQGFTAAIIEMKNNDFIICGRASPAFIMRITGDGEVVWDRGYEPEASWSEQFTCLREVENDIVAGGMVVWEAEYNNPSSFWLMRLDAAEGDPIWSRTFEYDHGQWGFSMATDGAGSVVLVGTSAIHAGAEHWSHDIVTLKVNGNGEELWHRRYNWGNEEGAENPSGIQRIENGDFIIVGTQRDYQQRPARPMAVRIRSDGSVRWRQFYLFRAEEGFGTTHGFSAVIIGNDQSIIGAGSTTFTRDNSGRNGMVMKLVEDVIGARILQYTPRDTVLTVLVDEAIEFTVRAVNARGERPPLLWLQDGDSLSTDSSVVIPFNDIGESLVQCRVFDADGNAEVRWHVEVTDLYIHTYSPDSLEMTLRRGTQVDFTLDSIATAGDRDSLRYFWSMTNLDNMENSELEGETEVSLDFMESGHYRIDATVLQGEASDEASWRIEVRGAIWSFRPIDTAPQVGRNGSLTFEVLPSNPDSDSLQYSWFFGEDLIAEGPTDSAVAIQFGDTGEVVVTAILTDGGEADTVRWLVRTVIPDGIEDCRLKIADWGIKEVWPNPFNSLITIRYQSAESAKSTDRLSIHDVSGREVARLAGTPPFNSPPASKGGNSVTQSLSHSVTSTWDASTMPAGVYLIRLQSGSNVAVKKVVLMR